MFDRRDHNTLGAAPQELYLWDNVAAASRSALAMRYKLLPFLYTLFYRAQTAGDMYCTLYCSLLQCLP